MKTEDPIVTVMVLFAIEADIVSLAQGAKIMGMSDAAVLERRTRTIAVFRKTFQEGKPTQPVPFLHRTGWYDSEIVPLARVKVVSVSPVPCVGCGGTAGAVEFLEVAKSGKVRVHAGDVIGPVCLGVIIFEDDPANARRITDIKARFNSVRN